MLCGLRQLSPRLLYEMLEVLLDQIARNGFKKS